MTIMVFLGALAIWTLVILDPADIGSGNPFLYGVLLFLSSLALATSMSFWVVG